MGSSSPAEDVETKIRVQVVYLRKNCRKHWWGSWDMRQRREASPKKSYEVSDHFGQLRFNPAGELDGTHVSEDTTREVGEVVY